jgi:hypothetical protein
VDGVLVHYGLKYPPYKHLILGQFSHETQQFFEIINQRFFDSHFFYLFPHTWIRWFFDFYFFKWPEPAVLWLGVFRPPEPAIIKILSYGPHWFFLCTWKAPTPHWRNLLQPNLLCHMQTLHHSNKRPFCT